MLEIRPVLNGPVVIRACRDAGIAPGGGCYLYEASDGRETLAYGLFEIKGDRVSAVKYSCSAEAREDHFLLDGILRAALNYASEQGVEIGELSETFRRENHALFSRLNYPDDTEMNIVNFFSKYKNCTPT